MILTSMLRQFSGIDFEQNSESFDYFADQFEKIPIYFQSFFGSTDPLNVINLIDYAIYTYDVGHIILDNLQFMLSGQGKGFERFELQDDLISKLRNIATEKNVHISLVIHPRKTDDNQDLHISSIFGTSKSTQESDNIYILQNRSKFKVIDIKKNRFDGEIGKAPIIFCRKTKRYYNINNADIEDIYNDKDIDLIVKDKKKLLEESLDQIYVKNDIILKEDEFFKNLQSFSFNNNINLSHQKEENNEDELNKDNKKKENYHEYFGEGMDRFKNKIQHNNECQDHFENNNLEEKDNILQIYHCFLEENETFDKELDENKYLLNDDKVIGGLKNDAIEKEILKVNVQKEKLEEKKNVKKIELKMDEEKFLTNEDQQIYETMILQQKFDLDNTRAIDYDYIEEIKNEEKNIFHEKGDEIIKIDHSKWNLDKKQNPNFYEEGTVMTYDDIINEITSKSYLEKKFKKGMDSQGYKNNKKKFEEKDFYDDYLDYKNNLKKNE